jgi:hypothetical protein
VRFRPDPRERLRYLATSSAAGRQRSLGKPGKRAGGWRQLDSGEPGAGNRGCPWLRTRSESSAAGRPKSSALSGIHRKTAPRRCRLLGAPKIPHKVRGAIELHAETFKTIRAPPRPKRRATLVRLAASREDAATGVHACRRGFCTADFRRKP